MDYEEQIVEDRLCWRTSKTSPWIPFAASELTTRCFDLTYRIEVLERTIAVLKLEVPGLS